MYKPTAKGYFSGAGGMEIGMMEAGVNVIQSLDIDPDSIACMKANPTLCEIFIQSLQKVKL